MIWYLLTYLNVLSKEKRDMVIIPEGAIETYLSQNRIQTSLSQYSIDYSGAATWHSIPVNIRLAKNIKFFLKIN